MRWLKKLPLDVAKRINSWLSEGKTARFLIWKPSSWLSSALWSPFVEWSCESPRESGIMSPNPDPLWDFISLLKSWWLLNFIDLEKRGKDNDGVQGVWYGEKAMSKWKDKYIRTMKLVTKAKVMGINDSFRLEPSNWLQLCVHVHGAIFPLEREREEEERGGGEAPQTFVEGRLMFWILRTKIDDAIMKGKFTCECCFQ